MLVEQMDEEDIIGLRKAYRIFLRASIIFWVIAAGSLVGVILGMLNRQVLFSTILLPTSMLSVLFGFVFWGMFRRVSNDLKLGKKMIVQGKIRFMGKNGIFGQWIIVIDQYQFSVDKKVIANLKLDEEVEIHASLLYQDVLQINPPS